MALCETFGSLSNTGQSPAHHLGEPSAAPETGSHKPERALRSTLISPEQHLPAPQATTGEPSAARRQHHATARESPEECLEEPCTTAWGTHVVLLEPHATAWRSGGRWGEPGTMPGRALRQMLGSLAHQLPEPHATFWEPVELLGEPRARHGRAQPNTMKRPHCRACQNPMQNLVKPRPAPTIAQHNVLGSPGQ